MGNIKTILAGLSLTMAVGMPAAASDELTMVVGTYTDQSTSDGMYVYRFNQRTGNHNWLAVYRRATLRFS